MTNLPSSPYLGQSVSVSGIVVGVMDTGGFYFSEPSGNWDSLVSTAEGMPVFYASATDNPACAVVGNTVTVIGTVINTTAATAANTPGTGIAPTSCTVTGTGTMTQAISLSSVLTSFGDALKYTGMAASNTSFYAVAPTGGTLVEDTETVTSNGQFWATLNSNSTTNNHLFRTAGIARDEYVPAAAPSTVATWAGNPQRILIDTTTFGGSPVDITVGQSIVCSVPSGITLGATKGIGLIDYTLGYARLLIFKSTTCNVSGTVAPTTSAAADTTHFHVGTLDLDRFYNTTGNNSGAIAISATAYARRLAKAADAIVSSLGKPDILSLQEVQDLAALNDLASAVNTLGGTSYVPSLIVGNDTSSLNLGFLVNSATVNTDSVTQVGLTDTYTAASGSASLWERPPLVLMAEFVRVGKNYPVAVINVHLTPRDNIGDATLGTDVRAHRAAQASALSTLVQRYQTAGANTIVAGNLNAFEFNDGYVDVTGVIDGSPAAASTVTLYQATSTSAALTDFVTQVDATSRYNYIDRGNAESLEHILASATVTDSTTAASSLASYVAAVTQPHFTTDFAAVNTNSSITSAGLSSHDGFVVAFAIPPVPTTASISATAIDFGDVGIGNSATRTVTITNTTTFASTVNVTAVAISGTNSGDFTESNGCSALTEGATCTVSITFTPTALGTRTALLTVTNDSTANPSLTATLTGNGVAGPDSDFTLSVAPTSGSTIAGEGKTLIATLTPVDGYSGTVSLSCTTTAAGSTCTPGSSSITFSAATTTSVAITTTSQYTVIGYTAVGLGLGPWVLLFALLSAAPIFLRPRRTHLPGLAALFAFAALIALSITGCSGKLPDKNATPTLPGTYTYTLTATDGAHTHTATYALTVTAK